MIRCLLRWLGTGLVALTLTAALAAQPSKQPATPSAPATSVERGPPIAAYAFAIVSTLLVVAVVAMRTRK